MAAHFIQGEKDQKKPGHYVEVGQVPTVYAQKKWPTKHQDSRHEGGGENAQVLPSPPKVSEEPHKVDMQNNVQVDGGG